MPCLPKGQAERKDRLANWLSQMRLLRRALRAPESNCRLEFSLGLEYRPGECDPATSQVGGRRALPIPYMPSRDGKYFSGNGLDDGGGSELPTRDQPIWGSCSASACRSSNIWPGAVIVSGQIQTRSQTGLTSD